MRSLIFFFLFFWYPFQMGIAQETLQLTTDKEKYNRGDTIHLTCTVPEWEGTMKLGTLNVLLEDINHNNAWRLRYPIVDGYFQADLVIPSNMPDNQYYFTAKLQPLFFQLTGKLLNRENEDSLRYTIQLEDKSIIAGMLGLNAEGSFRMPRHVFSGRATLFFSPAKPVKGKNRTHVFISTPLDSAYTALNESTLSVVIGTLPENSKFIRYKADSNLIGNQEVTLANVTVTGKAKTKVEKFDEQYSSGYFKAERTWVFGGLDGEFSGFLSILDYLQGRVAGLNISKNSEEMNQYLVTWRNEPTAFFLDEVPVDLETIYNFPPSEIAMVKVFPPPFMGVILGAGGGAIAIYSKRATLGLEPRYRNKFVIQGFSPSLSTLTVLSNRQKESN